MLLAALCLLLLPQEPSGPLRLEPGIPVAGRVHSGLPEAPNLTAEKFCCCSPHPAQSFQVTVAESGTYWFELETLDLAPMLVLRDADGNSLKDTWWGGRGLDLHMRQTLEAGVEYRLDVLGLHGLVGDFTITLHSGDRPPRSRERIGADHRTDLAKRRAHFTEKFGERSPEMAAMLTSFITMLGYEDHGWQGLWQELVPQVYAFKRELYGDRHPATLEALQTLVHMHTYEMNIDEAVETSDQQWQLAQELLGPEHMLSLNALKVLCAVYRYVKRTEDYYKGLRQLVSLETQRLGPRHEQTLRHRWTMVQRLNDIERFDEARTMVEALIADESAVYGSESTEIVGTVELMCNAVMGNAKPSQALARLTELRTEFIERLGKEHIQTTTVTTTMADLAEQAGERWLARDLLEETLAIEERRFGKSHDHPMGTRIELAYRLGNMGFPQEAIDLSEEMLRLVGAGDLSPDEELSPELRANIPRIVSASNLLANLYLRIGEKDKARRYAEQALWISEQYPGGAPELAKLRLGDVLIRQGELDRAQELYEELLEYFEAKSLRAAPTQLKNVYSGLALIHERRGELERAIHWKQLEWAAYDRESGRLYPLTSIARAHLAMLLREHGDLHESIRHFESVYRDSLESFERYALYQTETERLRFMSSVVHPEKYLRAQLRAGIDDFEGAYRLILPWKGRTRRALAMTLAASRGLDTEAHSTQRDELDRVAAELSGLMLLPADKRDLDHDQRLTELRKRRTRLEREVALALADRGLQPAATLEEVRAALPENSVLVDLYSSKESVAIVLHQSGPPQAISLKATDADVFAAQSKVIEPLVLRGGAAAVPKAVADDAYAKIWAPIADAVGDAEWVFVCPDAAFNELPFEVLRTPDGSYLLEKHKFVYLSDPTVLGDVVARPPSEDEAASLLLVGDVDYGEETGANGYAPLPGTRAELEQVRNAFPGSAPQALSGGAASEPLVRESIAGKRYVHLATHGYFETEESLKASGQERRSLVGTLLPSLLSGLVLAGANESGRTGSEDGYLSGEEIQGLDLSACELAVLSACETALGSSRRGDGLMSVRRAFEVAGARSVISSMWKVDDAATAALMQRFYENLWKRGMGKAEALHQAKLWLLRENLARDGRPRPETWGAFVLSGEWE